MIVTIVGSRRRDSEEDYELLYYTIFEIVSDYICANNIKDYAYKNIKIITGDCNKGGDEFARRWAKEKECEIDIKRIKDPETGEEMDFNNHRWFPYYEMVQIFYDRDEEIAKEKTDFFIALVAPDRKGGTEKTIKYFKEHDKDWEKKLIII